MYIITSGIIISIIITTTIILKKYNTNVNDNYITTCLLRNE